MDEEEFVKQVTLKVKALVREAREAYDQSHIFAHRIVNIPEIKNGLKLLYSTRRE